MFERFTDRARQVVVLAQDEALRHADTSIGTDHLLLSIARERDGIGARALRSFGLTPERLAELLRPGRAEVKPLQSGQMPFTAEAKASLEQAGREGRHLGDGTIGTEHVLLGVLRAGETSTLDALARAGVEPEALRKRVHELFAGGDASI